MWMVSRRLVASIGLITLAFLLLPTGVVRAVLVVGVGDGIIPMAAAFLRKAAILVTMQEAGTLGPGDMVSKVHLSYCETNK